MNTHQTNVLKAKTLVDATAAVAFNTEKDCTDAEFDQYMDAKDLLNVAELALIDWAELMVKKTATATERDGLARLFEAARARSHTNAVLRANLAYFTLISITN